MQAFPPPDPRTARRAQQAPPRKVEGSQAPGQCTHNPFELGNEVERKEEHSHWTTYSERYQELLEHLRVEPNPYDRVKLVAQLTRQIYETSTPEFDLLRGAGAIAPELADFYQEVEEGRRSLQERFITFLETCGVLRADLSHTRATDELWALTSFDLYRRLIMEREWSPEEYETWLAQTLIQQLFQA